MSSYPKIWFLRHGQTEWNKAYRLQGQLDSPLTPQGVADAARQARLIAPVLPQRPAIYVSPLGRTRHTADIALGGTPYETDDRLMEIHAGRWQGLLRSDIMQARADWAQSGPSALEIYEAAEGGEGIAAFQARILSFLRDLTGPTIVVAHGLWGQVMRGHILGLDVMAAGQLSNNQGCIYVLEQGRETVLEELE
ncbi:MAG: histidine phosphatase family protein [Sulfitobacter sp.]